MDERDSFIEGDVHCVGGDDVFERRPEGSSERPCPLGKWPKDLRHDDRASRARAWSVLLKPRAGFRRRGGLRLGEPSFNEIDMNRKADPGPEGPSGCRG